MGEWVKRARGHGVTGQDGTAAAEQGPGLQVLQLLQVLQVGQPLGTNLRWAVAGSCSFLQM